MKRGMMVAVMGLAMVGSVAWGQDAKPRAGKKVAAARTEESAVTPVVHLPERHDENMKRKEEGKIGLLFIGDSIMDRWPKFGTDTWEKFKPYDVADFGVGGDTTENVLWRIDHGELDGLNPKVTIIMIGTNNIGHAGGEKPAWAAAGVKKVLDEVHEKMPETKVLLLGVFPRDVKGSDKRDRAEAINPIISKFGDEKNTTYLDIGKVFLDENGEIPKDVMGDKLHPTAKGYQLWYDAMWPTLEGMLK